MIAIFIVAAIICLLFIIINLPVFGALPSGARLELLAKLPTYRNGALQNLSDTPMQLEGVSFFKLLKAFLFDKAPDNVPRKPLPFVQPELDKEQADEKPEIIWFGHSSYLIKIKGFRILVDPVFSKTPSPFSFIGSKAFPGTDFVRAQEFKNIDVLVITHDHYDHLDYKSILQIAPNAKKIITSLGVGSHLEKWGIKTEIINELSWHQSAEIFGKLAFTAVPTRHFTGRKFKRNQTLWSAFILQADNWKLFLGGDSGYDMHFKEIGTQYGPFDIALLECGQYNTYWPYIHMFPEDTVRAALDLNAKILMPVHWGKFSLAMHPWNEPIKRVVAEAERLNYPIVTPKLGETVVLSHFQPSSVWWQN